MGMGFIEVLMLIVMNGGGGTDLLDYMPTDYYWRQNSVLAVTPQAMINVLEDEDADAADRLMAIRTLGELGDAAALPVLEPLVESNEPFVGRYARRSIAWVRGEDPEPEPGVTLDALDADLALMPVETQIVGQSRGLGDATGPINLKQVLPDFNGDNGPRQEEMIEDIASQLLEVIEQIGNIRLDAVTLGMSFDEDESPAVIVVARGYYDRARVMGLLEDEQEMDLYSIDDIEVASSVQEWGESIVLMMPSDERFVFMFSEGETTQLPIDETAELILDGETEPSLGGVLLDELDHIDRAGVPVWMAMEVPAMLKQNEPGEVFGAFEAMRFVGEVTGDGGLAVSAVARGTDADAVAQTVEVVQGYINEGIAELQEEVQFDPAMAPMFDPILAMLRSIELSAEGETATGTMTVPDAGNSFFPLFLFGV